MHQHSVSAIHNLAFIGQSGAGKTSLIKQLISLTDTKASILSDTIKETLDATAWYAEHQGTHINFLDSPGYPDLSGRAMEVLTACDAAVLVLNASRGVEFFSQQIMQAAEERHLCRMIVVNHIDASNLDLPALMEQIQEVFGRQCLPLNLPLSAGDGVADCFFSSEPQSTLLGEVSDAHDTLVDQIVEVDEALMELYLEQGQNLQPEQLHDPFETAMREGHLIPVCFCSAQTQVGIDLLAKILMRLSPTPIEGNPPEFLKGEGDAAEPVSISQSADAHVLAHVFKVMVDPYVGKLGIFRVYQGTIKPGMQLYVGDARKPFKVVHLYKVQGEKLEEIEEAIPGDICAISKVEEIHYDSVLHDSHDEDHFHLRPLKLPPSMYGLALEAKIQGQEQKLSDVLHKMEDADPSIRVEHRPRLNETILWGLGEFHLRSVLNSMAQDFNLDVNIAPPSIEYRETISANAEGHHRHKKQTGGAGQFGEVLLRVEPLPRGSGFEFVNAVVGGAIPGPFIPAVEKGVRQAMDEGILTGALIEDLKVTVYDGKHHSVDSKEIAFVAAGKKAFIEAFHAANPVVLEPIADLKIIAPETSMGDITGELAAKSGMISGTQALTSHRVEIEAQAPLRELSDFQTRLKSLTGGEGYFSMTFSHYSPVTFEIQKQMIAEYQQS